MKPYLTTTLTYLGFSAAWILLSDQLVLALADDPATISKMQSFKGLVFVALSALLVFQVSRRLHEREQERVAERARLYRETMGAVQHVVRNFLNQMQVVTLEAEEHEAFDRDTLELAQRTTEDAEEHLSELASIQDLSSDSLRRFVDSTLGERRQTVEN